MSSPPPQSLIGWLASVVAAHGSRPAVDSDGESRTYIQVWSSAGGLARHLLRQFKLPTGSRVAILADNEPAYLDAFLGILRAGLVAVPLDPACGQPMILKQLHKRGVGGVLVGDRARAIHPEVIESFRTWPLEAVLAEVTPWYAGKLPPLRVNGDACILPCSGEGEAPNGAMHTQSSLLHSALQLATALPLRPEDRSSVTMPLAAALVTQVLPVWLTAGAIELTPDPDARRPITPSRQATCMTLEAAQLETLLESDRLEDLEALRWVCVYTDGTTSSAPVRRLQQTVPTVQVHQIFGMAEIPAVSWAPAALLRMHPGALGLPLPTTRVWQRPGTRELWVRSPGQMVGYVDDPTAVSKTRAPDGSLRLGLTGRIDDGGRIHLADAR